MKPSFVAVLSILLSCRVYGSLLDGLEHHGHHGDHHGDHGHGDHAHGEHDHGEHAHGEHAHGEHDHGDHAHGEHAHGEHAHEDHAKEEHAHGDEHNHDHDLAVSSQDNFGAVLASGLDGGFLSLVETTLAPPLAVAPAESFVAPGPVAPVETFSVPAVPTTTEIFENFVTPTSATIDFVATAEEEEQQPLKQLQQTAEDNSIQFPEKEQTTDRTSSGDAKQLANVGGNRGTGDYPEYAVVPRTSFSCGAQATGGYFADPEAECQVFHICLNGQNMGSFLCPNGTLFHQQYFVCDWWFNVDCGASEQSYGLNAQIGIVPESQ
ncbi:sperm acrosomal protein FSA-ACR.1-like [Palaemon carinicauda]|uniref:sperm acrosomal protein FSA-ACR.1-like n=1 Tax=Palaemon carinicauda TaxID=392227 RepID=UPI0035B5F04F